jgi:hypothetical protein
MDKNTEKLIKDFLQDVEINDDDLKRKAVVPDELLARAFKFISQRRPWSSDADVLRELVLKEVLRHIEGGSKDERIGRIEKKLEAHDTLLVRICDRLGVSYADVFNVEA